VYAGSFRTWRSSGRIVQEDHSSSTQTAVDAVSGSSAKGMEAITISFERISSFSIAAFYKDKGNIIAKFISSESILSTASRPL
jgi:hypothetical protein